MAVTQRVHGMNPPYHPLQIMTWLIYPLLILHYFLLVMPLLNSLVVKIITALLFGISAVVALVAGGITATIDPADDACLGKEHADYESTLICHLCQTYVEKASKHCRTCGKCVQNFDHHCKWLNTCIGKKNYRYFLTLMGGVAGMTSVSLSLSAYSLAMCFMDKDVIKDRIEESSILNGVINYWAVVCLMIVSIVVLAPLVALLYQLMAFHAMLVNRGITTYDYIVAEQKRLREKKRAISAARNQPPVSSDAHLPSKEAQMQSKSPQYDKASQNDEDEESVENRKTDDNGYSLAPEEGSIADDKNQQDDDDANNDEEGENKSSALVMSKEDNVNENNEFDGTNI